MRQLSIKKHHTKQVRQAKKSHKRSLKSIIRRQNSRKRKKLLTERLKHHKKTFKFSQDIEQFCHVNNINIWANEVNLTIRINDEVSLFKNPENVIRILLRILHNAKQNNVYPTLEFESRISFGALYLIDNICWEIGKKRNWGIRLHKIDENDKRILSNLKSLNSSEYDNEYAYMINEKVSINRKSDATYHQQYKVKSKNVTDMIQRAIRETYDENFELSPAAYQAISSTIGEHFDNIIQHVPNAEHAYLCGFYDKERKEVVILIFNFGNTISETLKSNQLPKEIKYEIEQVIKNHKKKKYILMGDSFTESNALTLLAIQEGISSKLNYDKSRGHGIMDFIEHCFELNENCKIVMISGQTAIKIDKSYKIGKTEFSGRNRRILAFNERNDLFEKPDSNFVLNLPLEFPGVIIETRIPLEIQ